MAITLCIAAGVIVLSFFLLRGPRLGPYYDYLLRFLAPAPVSGELLLIETRLPGSGPGDDFIDPASAVSVLMTMTEMSAGTLILQAPVLETPLLEGNPGHIAKGIIPGAMGDITAGREERELRSRFDGEFNLIERNIRNLFEAIRLGFILPSEAERYVGELVTITGRGKDRLLAAAFPSDKSGKTPLEQSLSVFGRVWVPGKGLYSRSLPDWDGRFRRTAPVIAEGDETAEHIVYAALKDRLAGEAIPEALLHIPLVSKDFRRLPLAVFLEYDQADQTLIRLLGNAENQGIYKNLNPESNPGYLYGYAQDMREELLASPDQEKRTLWLEARDNYFQSLDDFFNGPSETSMVDGYERMIASESLEDEGIRRITALRNELILTFRNLREEYADLLTKRAGLEADLSGSFCILGPPDLESSAFMANTLLTGKKVTPGSNRDIILWSLLGVLVILAGISPMGPWVTLGAGLFLTLALGLGFSYSFILRAYWIDPLIPLGAAAVGVLSSFVFALWAKHRAAASFRWAYGSRMAPAYLRRLIRADGSLPSRPLSANAAMVAVRDGSLTGLENRSSPGDAAKAAAAFREEAFRIFSAAGGVMTGMEGDLVIFAFGSPQERRAMVKMKSRQPYDDGDLTPAPRSPGTRAAGLVIETLKNCPQAASWRFAIDTGECCFSWSRVSGFTAAGHAVVSARLLSNLTQRYKTRVLVSRRISEKLGEIPAKKLGVLVDQDGGGREEFYELGSGEGTGPGDAV